MIELSPLDWMTIGDSFAGGKHWKKAFYCYDKIMPNGDAFPRVKQISALVNIGTKDALKTANNIALFLVEKHEHEAPSLWARGAVALADNRFQEAANLFIRAHGVDDQESRYACDAALALQQCGRWDDAKAMYESALAVNPLKIEVRTWYGMLLMLMGETGRGWNEYEARAIHDSPVPINGKPIWNGESLAGKTIALFQEQGIGDTVQFLRYAAALKSMGGRVIAVVRDNLYRLARAVDGVDDVAIFGGELPDYDYHIRMMSLGRVAHHNGIDVGGGRYLRAAPTRDESIKFRIGICWHGERMHANDKFRSMPFETLAPILSISGQVEFVNLQFGEPKAGVLQCDQTDVYSLAQYVASCDLVVTVDTAVAHIAGAMGVRCFLLLPFAPDWRWGLTCGITPWYYSLSLYRCQRPLEWGPVVEKVKGDIEQCVASTAIQQT